VTHADPLAGGLGPCVPGTCPTTYRPVGNGPFAGRDNGVNVFVGGTMRVTGSAAEAEGRVVVGGDFTLRKTSGSSIYNVGSPGSAPVCRRRTAPTSSPWAVTSPSPTPSASTPSAIRAAVRSATPGR
jgi:hypothetical protein